MKININDYNDSIHVNTDKLYVQNKTENIIEKSAGRKDSITISDEGKQFLEKRNSEDRINKINDFCAKHDELYAEQTASAMKHVTDAMETAMEIYRRIAGGAKVSPDDEQFLMLYSRPMYMAAKNAQEMKEKNEDMSDESLIKKFEEQHADDRKDWTSELNGYIEEINKSDMTADISSDTAVDL